MKTEPKRESREFWTSHEGRVFHVTGYSCAPQNPEHWWCPQIGYTVHSDTLFDTRSKAVAAAKRECLRNIEMWERKLGAL